ncbi:MAG: GNAT family N-acetyltransferase [Flavobacteriaceae bacterium]|nr:GNAT family N-acetyltransferase [Flavobacteriaceae bacterium]
MAKLNFTYLTENNIAQIVPLMQDFTSCKYSDEVLLQRHKAMFSFDYDCLAITIGNTLIGFCGLWYQMRHYSGKSCELDHFYIEKSCQGKGYGKQMLDWLSKELKDKGYEAIELNAYKENSAAHRFYQREGFDHLGFHYVKRL